MNKKIFIVLLLKILAFGPSFPQAIEYTKSVDTKTEGVFGWTNHCQTKICYHPVPAELSQQIYAITKKASLGKIIQLRQIDAAEISSNNFRVDLANGHSMLLRRAIRFTDDTQQGKLIKIWQQLEAANINLPHLDDRHTESLPFLVGPDEQKWLMYEFIDANHYLRGSEEEIKNAAREICKMHTVFRTIHQCKPVPHQQKLSLHRFQHLVRLAQESNDEYSQLICNQAAVIEQVIHKVEKYQLPSDEQLIHGDLHPHNMLIGEKFWLVDFDAMKYGHLCSDIAFAMHRLVRQGVFHFGIEQLPKLVDAFVRGYGEKLDFVVLEHAALLQNLNDIEKLLSWRYEKNDFTWSSDIPKKIYGMIEIQQIFSNGVLETFL